MYQKLNLKLLIMNKKSLLRYSLLMAGFICTMSLNAQRLVQPGVRIVDRFKQNVPSLVVKGNPLTMPFGYFDAGVEYRTQRSGWLLYTHGFLRGSNSVESANYNFNLYVETQNYGRFEFGRRWYWQNTAMWNANRETYFGLTMNAGFTNYKFTDGFYYDDFGEVVLLTPLQDASRIDMILAAERGRTRNWAGPNADFYGETAWKLGYNFGARMPVLLYAIRFNYKVN